MELGARTMELGARTTDGMNPTFFIPQMRDALILATLLTGTTACPVAAQTINPNQIPNPIPPTPPQQEAPPPLPPQQNPLPQPPDAPTPASEPLNFPGTFTVEGFEFAGNTKFDSDTLAGVIKEFRGKEITFAQLQQAASKITEYYTSQGYITSGAYIPAQTPQQTGVFLIQVVEGELEDIKITGTDRLKPEYVRSRIALATAKPLNVDKLREALQLLQLDPLIENLSAELSAGTQPGMNLLVVRVKEAQSFSTGFLADNGRSPSAGSFRRQVGVAEGNLLGFGDKISLTYSNTTGSNAIDAGYTLPVNSRNGTVTFSYSNTGSNITEPPFDELDIEANSRNYELTYRQPVIRNATPEFTQEFALGLTASRRESDTSLQGEDFPISPGADDRGRTRISALRFFQEWVRRGRQDVLAARSQFSLGVGAFDATINNSAPDSRFFAWRGQVQWFHQLDSDSNLLLSGGVQLADRALVPLEQFGLGGLGTVRGYRQDALLTDNGAFASVELRVPVYRGESGVLQLTPFVDAGTVWNSGGKDSPNPNTLVGAGVGLRWQSGNRFSARLDYSIPLVNVESEKRTWQENGLYFSVEYNP